MEMLREMRQASLFSFYIEKETKGGHDAGKNAGV